MWKWSVKSDKVRQKSKPHSSVLQSGGWTLRHCELRGLQCYFNFSFTFPSVTQQRTEWYQTVQTGSGLTVDQHGLQSLVLCWQLSLLSLQLPNPRSQEVKFTGVSWGQRWHAWLHLHHLGRIGVSIRDVSCKSYLFNKRYRTDSGNMEEMTERFTREWP